jgi:hypothetical protein
VCVAQGTRYTLETYKAQADAFKAQARAPRAQAGPLHALPTHPALMLTPTAMQQWLATHPIPDDTTESDFIEREYWCARCFMRSHGCVVSHGSSVAGSPTFQARRRVL